MTKNQKKTIDNMSDDKIQRQIIITKDIEILEYLHSRLERPQTESAMVEGTDLSDFGGH